MDEEPFDSDFLGIGRAAIELRFSNAEIRTIYWREVVPAIAGSWIAIDAFDAAWLEQRIRHRPFFGCPLTFFLRPWWIWVCWGYWRQIKNAIEAERRGPKHEFELKPFASIEDVTHDSN
jgi:hypothetical protein